LRIAVIADRLSARGGADWHLLGVLERLAAQHDVHLAAGLGDGSALSPCPWVRIPGLEDRERQRVEGLDAWVRRMAPDVLHLHNVVNPWVLEWAAQRGAVVTVQDHRAFCPGQGKLTAGGSPCVAPMAAESCRGCFTDEGYFARIWELTHQRLQALRSMRVVVLSRYMESALVEAGVPRSSIRVVPPFVHGLDAQATPAEPHILFAGRLVRAKGVWDAVAAWHRSQVDLPLVFAGTGSERNRLEAQGHRVLGWLGHRELSRWYLGAAALVLPSRWQEPFGIVGLEALRLGTPVVAWHSGGVSEWHNDADLLVPWGDVDALAGALRRALGRPAVWPKHFEAEARMAELEEVYRRLP
jgi:glycosyltransferase involved in cell wall biosynthesis